MPKIAIGCVVRNRAWILPEYLKALSVTRHEDKAFLFLENDSEDETWDILDEFSGYGTNPSVDLHTMTTKVNHWDRVDYSINQYENLAIVRNEFVEWYLTTDADYLLSVDSDIIVPPNIIELLLKEADGNTIVGAAISNIPNMPLDGKIPGNFMVYRSGFMVHPPAYPMEGTHDVDLIGAVYLIPRQALEDGVRYAPYVQGEDIPFCIQAKQMGYKLKVCMDVICEHRMTK